MTHSHKTTSMRPSRSCWNGTTSTWYINSCGLFNVKYCFICIYSHLQTDCFATLQCGQDCQILVAGIETRLTQMPIKDYTIHFTISRSIMRFVFFNSFICLFCSYIPVCFQLVAFIREHIWHKALLMVYSMRLELTHVAVWIIFSWLWVYIEIFLFFLRGCFDILLWTPSHGWAKAGWPARTYIQQLCADEAFKTYQKQ